MLWPQSERALSPQGVAVLVEGHQDVRINGVYKHQSSMDGSINETDSSTPLVLRSVSGAYCYRLAHVWFLITKRADLVDPLQRKDNVVCANIDAPEGPLPVGEHSWRCQLGGRADMWTQHTLTVSLLVRCQVRCACYTCMWLSAMLRTERWLVCSRQQNSARMSNASRQQRWRPKKLRRYWRSSKCKRCGPKHRRNLVY